MRIVTVLCAGQSDVRIPGRAQDILSLVHITQTGCGAHLPFYSMGTDVHFRRVRRPGRQAEQVLPSRAEVKNEWTYTSVPPVCAFVAWIGALLPLPSLLPC